MTTERGFCHDRDTKHSYFEFYLSSYQILELSFPHEVSRLYGKCAPAYIESISCLRVGRYGEIPGCNIAVTAGIILFTTPYSTVHKVWLSNKLYSPSVNSVPSRSGNSRNAATPKLNLTHRSKIRKREVAILFRIKLQMLSQKPDSARRVRGSRNPCLLNQFLLIARSTSPRHLTEQIKINCQHRHLQVRRSGKDNIS